MNIISPACSCGGGAGGGGGGGADEASGGGDNVGTTTGLTEEAAIVMLTGTAAVDMPVTLPVDVAAAAAGGLLTGDGVLSTFIYPVGEPTVIFKEGDLSCGSS